MSYVVTFLFKKIWGGRLLGRIGAGGQTAHVIETAGNRKAQVHLYEQGSAYPHGTAEVATTSSHQNQRFCVQMHYGVHVDAHGMMHCLFHLS